MSWVTHKIATSLALFIKSHRIYLLSPAVVLCFFDTVVIPSSILCLLPKKYVKTITKVTINRNFLALHNTMHKTRYSNKTVNR